MRNAILMTAVVALFAGCICCSSGTDTGVQTSSPGSDAAYESSSIASSGNTATTSPQNAPDISKVSVALAGCDDDHYGNAMVAGYATNSGVKTVDAVTIVTQLQAQSGDVVSGGEKRIVIESLKPGEHRKFSVVYERPPAWKRCRASVNGMWSRETSAPLSEIPSTTTVATQGQTEEDCSVVSHGGLRDQCYIQYAIWTNDQSLCEKANYIDVDVAICQILVAGDASQCAQIPDDDTVKFCQAVIKNDPSICDSLPIAEDKQFTCNGALAVWKKNDKACAKIGQPAGCWRKSLTTPFDKVP